MKKYKRYGLLIAAVIVCLLLAAAAFAQHRNIGPSSSEIIHIQQIQALRAEMMQLRIQLTACRGDLTEANKELEKCDQDQKTKEDKPEPKTGNEPITPVPLTDP